jgi:hypothetical protein
VHTDILVCSDGQLAALIEERHHGLGCRPDLGRLIVAEQEGEGGRGEDADNRDDDDELG